MEPELGPHGETLPLDAIERMVRARRAFESAWKSGSEPSIEEALGDSQGAERAQLLQDLIALDFDHRRQRGENPNRESYEARFSSEASLVKALFSQLEGASSSSLDPTEPQIAQPQPAPPHPAEPPGPAAYRSVDPRRLLGTSIGPYRLLDILGEGGMGVVYLAEQREPIHRRGALKVIKLGMDTKEVIARFEAERQALAMMSHPSIAKVFDAGSTPDGRPYFVMEHVPGEPITQYCDRHRLSTKERLQLFLPVCDAIQHAHQKAIIHRDLKPSNVLVMLQDGKPVPKVIDFGVAKATDQRLTEKTIYTELGQIIGTPEYMSPEQAERGGVDIDTRTDIYSLGVLLYELLTGELPFSREELRRAGYAEIQRIIREREPPKPSTRLSTVGDAAQKAAERRQTNLDARPSSSTARSTETSPAPRTPPRGGSSPNISPRWRIPCPP